MEENTNQETDFSELPISLPTPRKSCVSGHQAYMICCTNGCVSDPFICTEKGCHCLFKAHKECMHVGWSNIIDRVSTKRAEVTKEFLGFCMEVENIYNQVLEDVSLEKEAFLNWRENVGLNQCERTFMEKIQKTHQMEQNGNQEKETQLFSGTLIHELIENISKKENFYVKEKEEVRKQWSLYAENLAKSLKKLKNLYLSPSKLKPKTVQNIEELSKLFEKEPMKYNLLYQGTKQNFSIKAFHQKCDSVTDTLTVMKTMTGLIIGGFTNLAWQSNETGQWIDDPQKKTFTFTEVNKKLNKHVSTNKNIFKFASWGPTFGAGTDLIVYEAGCLNENLFLERPASYGNRSFNIYTSKNPREKNQALVEIEIYEVLWD